MSEMVREACQFVFADKRDNGWGAINIYSVTLLEVKWNL